MAHLSGRNGTMVMGTASSTEFGPTSAMLDLQAWTLTQETDSFEAFSKADDFVTSFTTVTRWSGSATFLHEDGGTTSNLVIRDDGSEGKAIAALDLTVDGTDKYEGLARITRAVVECPLDGPVTYVVDFVGDGALTFTGA